METTGMLRIGQAAKHVGMTEGGIRYAMRSGALPFVEYFGIKLVKESDLDIYRATVKMGRPKKSEEQAS